MNVTFHNSFLFFLTNGSGSGLREPDCNHYMRFLSQATILTDAASHLDRCSRAWERYTISFPKQGGFNPWRRALAAGAAHRGRRRSSARPVRRRCSAGGSQPSLPQPGAPTPDVSKRTAWRTTSPERSAGRSSATPSTTSTTTPPMAGVGACRGLTSNWWLALVGAAVEGLWLLFAPDSAVLYGMSRGRSARTARRRRAAGPKRKKQLRRSAPATGRSARPSSRQADEIERLCGRRTPRSPRSCSGTSSASSSGSSTAYVELARSTTARFETVPRRRRLRRARARARRFQSQVEQEPHPRRPAARAEETSTCAAPQGAPRPRSRATCAGRARPARPHREHLQACSPTRS